MKRHSWKPAPMEALYGKRGQQARQKTPLQQFVAARLLGRSTDSRVIINERTAITISAVYAAVRIRAGLLSSLPLKVMQRSADGKDGEVSQHPLSQILKTSPNPYQTAATFQEQGETHLSLWGNQYAELTFDNQAEVVSAVRLHPGTVEPFIDTQQRDPQGWPLLKYHVYDGGSGRVLDASQIHHVPGLGFDGLVGFSVISLGAESFGIAKSGDRLAAQFNGSAAKPFLIVETPEYLDDSRHATLSREIRDGYNEDNAFSSLLLEGGATAKFPAMPLRDAQFLESRQFQGEEIASRWFGLPPHLAGYLDNAHYNNVEEQDRSFLVFTLAPQLLKSEQEWNRKGFTQADRNKGLYVKYNVDALLRGAQKERYDAHTKAIQAGWKTINEVRQTEDLPPLPGGDELPKPAAIWGPSATPSPAPQAGRSQDLPTSHLAPSADPRLVDLTTEVLGGLHRAELTHIERHLGKPDFQTRLRDFYETHERRVLDKLKALQVDPVAVLDHCRAHRDQASQVTGAEDLQQLTQTWAAESQTLAAVFCG